ncbi:HAD-IIIA family hydrolase [Agaribacter marinus]|uniref:D,D-heptose 1,7-bisphosphate phosphatase n=1 Tax=Virgibacillus salarius TaxID=447199 RepID=A0A941IAR8_9BACI|nr:HAD family hydrolase [Virgibacillus salarius]MBR7798244.1 HAD family hydrolase [Virgibacillus salarius]NAZ10952.1 HAD-IIIA family hydrolase [Agaribacter marinus]
MKQPAMFLDRDGVINEVLTERVKFVNQPEDFYLLDGVGEAINLFNHLGYKVFVVTNQGGIGLGYMNEAALHQVHQRMKEEIAEFHGVIDDIAYCPHKPHANCACRKPQPQMIYDLARKHAIDLRHSYMVGDREMDIEAGKKAGVNTILVGDRRHAQQPTADLEFKDLWHVAHYFKWNTNT